MSLNYKDPGVEEAEYSRRLILDDLRDMEILLDNERKDNGTETARYSRLDDKIQAMKYSESLILKELRTMLA